MDLLKIWDEIFFMIFIYNIPYNNKKRYYIEKDLNNINHIMTNNKEIVYKITTNSSNELYKIVLYITDNIISIICSKMENDNMNIISYSYFIYNKIIKTDSFYKNENKFYEYIPKNINAFFYEQYIYKNKYQIIHSPIVNDNPLPGLIHYNIKDNKYIYVFYDNGGEYKRYEKEIKKEI